MRTAFSAAQLTDANTAVAAGVIRSCVHCGFCNATCPTYTLLGDELDGPRGRIYLIKDMLEAGRAASAREVLHIDRCLSCLACMSTCPSGVNYMHLIDHARVHVARTYRRPWMERVIRAGLAAVLPRPWLLRAALRGMGVVRPVLRALPRWALPGPLPQLLPALLALAPAAVPAASGVDAPQVFAAEGVRRRRVALLSGCAQRVLAPQINEATIRVLTRHGCEVVVTRGAGCCGALTHHMGDEDRKLARANVMAWARELAGEGLDAVVINTSGCGTMVKDYGFLFREDAELAAAAAAVSAMARDVTELLGEIGLVAPVGVERLRVAYHAACSLQHGQQVRAQPVALLEQAGFTVLAVPEGHLCCGSAGTYNLLQPEIATQLRDRKVAHVEAVAPDVVAAGNVGCMTQIASGTRIPVVHTVELLDWATGGPRPAVAGK